VVIDYEPAGSNKNQEIEFQSRGRGTRKLGSKYTDSTEHSWLPVAGKSRLPVALLQWLLLLLLLPCHLPPPRRWKPS
jgi:hypothetical protein